jgi:hypothetical protein
VSIFWTFAFSAGGLPKERYPFLSLVPQRIAGGRHRLPKNWHVLGERVGTPQHWFISR